MRKPVILVFSINSLTWLLAATSPAQTLSEMANSTHPSATPPSAGPQVATPPVTKKDQDDDPKSNWLSLFDSESSKSEKQDNDSLGAVSLATLLVTSPFWIPAAATDGRSEDSRLLSRPFKNHEPSNIDYVPATKTTEYWSGRGRVEYQLASEATSLAGETLVETLWGWGIDGESAYRYNSRLRPDSSIWTGNVDITYRFAFTERIQFRTGLGVNWLHDDIDTEFGLNWTYQFDVFHAHRWIWSTEFDLGRLGNTSQVHWRTSIGYHYDHWEPYIGYDHFQISAAPLDSIVAGIRFWF